MVHRWDIYRLLGEALVAVELLGFSWFGRCRDVVRLAGLDSVFPVLPLEHKALAL